jgi:[acyl-carrier-protein] S-malonyltransferase
MTVTDVAATVRGEPITVGDVDARMASVRATGFGARVADPHTAEGRNARRWVVQLLCAERLVRAELAARGSTTGADARPLSVDRALALGGVGAAVLATVPDAAHLVTEYAEPVDEATVREYFTRNPERFAGATFAAARERIAAELRAARADRAFGQWLEQRLAADVVLAPGYEHPADPRHPDATHRH